MYSTPWTTVADCPFEGFAWRADEEPTQFSDSGTLIVDEGGGREAIGDISFGWYATLREGVEHCTNDELSALMSATRTRDETIAAIGKRVEERTGRQYTARPASRIVTLAAEYGSEFPYARQAVAGGAMAIVEHEQRDVRSHNALSNILGEVNASANAVRNVYKTITSVVPPRLLAVTASLDTVPAGSATTTVSVDALTD